MSTTPSSRGGGTPDWSEHNNNNNSMEEDSKLKNSDLALAKKFRYSPNLLRSI
jgi:hypothetical protein